MIPVGVVSATLGNCTAVYSIELRATNTLASQTAPPRTAPGNAGDDSVKQKVIRTGSMFDDYALLGPRSSGPPKP